MEIVVICGAGQSAGAGLWWTRCSHHRRSATLREPPLSPHCQQTSGNSTTTVRIRWRCRNTVKLTRGKKKSRNVRTECI